MNKSLLFSFVFVFLTALSFAQKSTQTNKYYIYVDNLKSENIASASELISQITGAGTINYLETEKAFVVTTQLELNSNVISGKLQKNMLPLIRMVKIGDGSGFPKMANTGNAEQDAKNYELEKAAWIKEHPEEYKEMIQASQTK